MKTHTLYTFDPGTRIDLKLPGLIAKAKESHEDIYLSWNDDILLITEESTPESIWNEHREHARRDADANLMIGVRNLIGRWDGFNSRGPSHLVEAKVWDSGHGHRDLEIDSDEFQRILRGYKDGDRVILKVAGQFGMERR